MTEYEYEKSFVLSLSGESGRLGEQTRVDRQQLTAGEKNNEISRNHLR